MILVKLFLKFCQIGVIAFGGGNAIFPILHHEIVEKLQWISPQDFLNFVSIAETTPGPVGMNLSTFIGFKLAGFTGALVATTGYVFLPFLIMLIVATVAAKIKDNIIYKRILSSIMVVVLVLLMRVVYLIAKDGFLDFRPYLLSLAVLFLFMKFKKWSPIYLLLAAGLIGMIVF